MQERDEYYRRNVTSGMDGQEVWLQHIGEAALLLSENQNSTDLAAGSSELMLDITAIEGTVSRAGMARVSHTLECQRLDFPGVQHKLAAHDGVV